MIGGASNSGSPRSLEQGLYDATIVFVRSLSGTSGFFGSIQFRSAVSRYGFSKTDDSVCDFEFRIFIFAEFCKKRTAYFRRNG